MKFAFLIHYLSDETRSLMQEHGIYTQVARSNPRVLRIQPPLTVTEEQAAHFLDALTQTCSDLAFLMDVADRVLSKSVGTHQGGPAGNGRTSPSCEWGISTADPAYSI